MRLPRLAPLAIAAALAAALIAGPAQAQSQAQTSRALMRAVLAPGVGMLLGILSGATGGVAGALVGGCFNLAGAEDPTSAIATCAGAVLGGVMVGFLLGTPAGVTWISDLLGGRGNFGGAFAGVLVGMVATAFIAFSLTPTLLPPRPEALGPILFWASVLPPAGAVIGYEIVSAMNDMITPPPVSLAPVIQRGQLAGVMLGLSVARF